MNKRQKKKYSYLNYIPEDRDKEFIDWLKKNHNEMFDFWSDVWIYSKSKHRKEKAKMMSRYHANELNHL